MDLTDAQLHRLTDARRQPDCRMSPAANAGAECSSAGVERIFPHAVCALNNAA